eukprot:m.189186 g.189186  ORF g.189186 m.189186 type:complete len:324 (+) comp18203_c0_seq2:698-1669(+)
MHTGHKRFENRRRRVLEPIQRNHTTIDHDEHKRLAALNDLLYQGDLVGTEANGVAVVAFAAAVSGVVDHADDCVGACDGLADVCCVQACGVGCRSSTGTVESSHLIDNALPACFCTPFWAQRPIVIASVVAGVCNRLPNNSNFAASLEGQNVLVVFEQHHGLACRVEGHVLVGLLSDNVGGDVAVRVVNVGIKQAREHAHLVAVAQGQVDGFLRRFAERHALGQIARVGTPRVNVSAALEAVTNSKRCVGLKIVRVPNAPTRVRVGGYVALVTPVLAQRCVERRVATRRKSIDHIVRAHNAEGVALLDGALPSHHVRVGQIIS